MAASQLSGCALNRVPPPPAPADSAVARTALTESLNRYWRSVVPRRPDLAAALGRRVRTPIPSPLEAADDNQAVGLARQLGAALDNLDPAALTPRDYATLQTLRWELDAAAEATAYSGLDFSLISPSRTALRQALRVLDEHPFAVPADLDRYLFLLDGVAFWVQDARTVLNTRLERGSAASVDAVRSFELFVRRLRDLAIANDWRVTQGRLATIDTGLVADFRVQERESIAFRLLPALDTLLTYLGEYATRAMPRPGLWQVPGGKEYYRHLLRRTLGLEIEPEEAHRAGLSALRRVDSLLTAVRRRVAWTGSIKAFHDSLSRMSRFAPINADSTVVAVQSTLALIRDTLNSRIKPLPDTQLVIRRATPFEQLLFPDGAVRPPEYVDSLAEVLITKVWGSSEGRVEGKSRVFRWTWPGAALAATASYASDSLSPFVLLHPSAATQAGWAEYGASLAGELGMYSDPLDAYGQLLHEGWNAALLLADTGLHYYGWSRQQALAVLRPYTLLSEASLDSTFVEQVVQAPGRAGAAVIGAREYAAMRAWMQRLLGASFDLSAWHAAVISLGPVPLPVLAAYLEWWGWKELRRKTPV